MRTALITGGVSGIGAACAARLAADGHKVITADVHDDADVVVDIADLAATRAALDRIGPVDVLVHCAAVIGPNKPMWEVTDEEWERTIAINLNGTFAVCRAVIPGMIANGWGRIVTIASTSGKEGSPQLAAYSASKAGVIGLTKSLGKELATTGVLVNTITPTVVATPMAQATDASVVKYLTERIPMARLGRPEEVAELVAWLTSDRCSFSTGAVYDISGGRAAY
ncbi:SDR family oxidoreductase [Micromonospora sp. NPDC005087]|uniref:SDR family oxidoreductase n=1 Tax=Micromonospora sp. NPDC005087 TaxID=3364225 RepID=UPI003697D569